MPLSPPAKRNALHRRTIVIDGYHREDGLWDIEGHLTDTKTYGFDNSWRGHVEPGVPVHEMWVRLTIDDDMLITACEASTEHHPFPNCAEVTPNFAGLAGIRIGPGWTREVRQRVGGVHGCTHIVEMLSQVGTVAYQTHVAKRAKKSGKSPADGKSKRKPAMLDQCYALRTDGEVVAQMWPEYYTGASASSEKPET